MDTSIVEKIIQYAKGKLDECEVCLSISESKEANFASNKLKSSEGKGARSVAVRGFIGGKMGFYATSDLSSPESIVEATVELANEGGPHEIELPSDFSDTEVDTFDERVAGLSPAEHVSIGRELIGMIQDYDPKYLNEVEVSSIVEHVLLANSKGGQGRFKCTCITALVAPTFTDESGFTEIYEYDFPTHLPEGGFGMLSERAIEKLSYCEKEAKARTGEYDILLMPKAMDILYTIQTALNARAVLKGYSPWKDKLGEQVADEKFSLIDDPLTPGHVGSQPFDDEGTTSRPKALIDGGKLNLFFNDLFSAAKLGLEPTGNAFRAGSKSEPRASASTLFLNEGERDFRALVSGMKNGIVVDQIMGAHTASPFSGDFSVNIEMGWLVQDGEILGRIKDCMLAGNIFAWIKDNLIEIGRGAQRAGSSSCLPPILFADCKVAAGE